MGATPEQLLEQTLVIRSQLGDETAFADLLRLNGPRLLSFTERMMSSCPGQIADVMQDTWIAIYRALPKLMLRMPSCTSSFWFCSRMWRARSWAALNPSSSPIPRCSFSQIRQAD